MYQLQVAYETDDPKTKEREVKALLETSAELKCESIMIINEKEETEETINGKKIKYAPLWKWLLDYKTEI